MKLFLFLDDWMLDGYRDVVRVFPQPRLVDDGPQPDVPMDHSVWRDPETGRVRCWYLRFDRPLAGTPDRPLQSVSLADSDDAVHFRPLAHGGPIDPRAPWLTSSLHFPEVETRGGCENVALDLDDPDPARRYKAVGYNGWLYLSPDGIRWSTSDIRCFDVPGGSDAVNPIFWNPVARCWGVICRPANADRRVALVESTDLTHWTEPRIVVQPDAMDEPLLQLYGMPPYWYEDLFIGLLWTERIPMEESGRPHKMYGRIYGQLAYSYDGRHWLRPNRQSFIPLLDPPEFGCGEIAPKGMLVDGERILLYACGDTMQHDQDAEFARRVSAGQTISAMRVFALRRDGFAYLESAGGRGLVRTRGLLPAGGQLSVNYLCSPGGEVRVQAVDADNTPLPSYSFAECAPLTGGSIAGVPRWGERRSEQLAGRWCRLEFQLYDARLYAYRWDAQLAYAKTPRDRL